MSLITHDTWTIILNVIGGGLTALGVFGIQHIRKYIRMRRVFGSLAGNYLGYSYKGFKVGETPQSKATIRHKRGNILEIWVEHDNMRWDGIIIMNTEDENVGRIAWQYTKLPEDGIKFGFKDCIIDRSRHWIYLIGDKTEGYDKEILKPKDNNEQKKI